MTTFTFELDNRDLAAAFVLDCRRVGFNRDELFAAAREVPFTVVERMTFEALTGHGLDALRHLHGDPDVETVCETFDAQF